MNDADRESAARRPRLARTRLRDRATHLTSRLRSRPPRGIVRGDERCRHARPPPARPAARARSRDPGHTASCATWSKRPAPASSRSAGSLTSTPRGSSARSATSAASPTRRLRMPRTAPRRSPPPAARPPLPAQPRRQPPPQPRPAHHGRHADANRPPSTRLHRPQRAEGKTTLEAIRSLKRHLSDVVYRQLQTDAATHPLS